MKIKKGDKVKVLSGKDKGKVAAVVAVLRDSNRVVVEGVNMVTKFEKKQSDTKKGGVIRVEAPMGVSKVQVVDAEGKPTRIGYEIKDGKKIRIAKRTKKQLS
jgi:large subunit ribosomal protein L24